jgi:3-dehydroquinate dehydratase type I
MICIPILAKDNDIALEKMVKAEALADVLEIRLDVMESFNLEEIIRAKTRPLIITYRSKKEGGCGSLADEAQYRYLGNAIASGADYVDVEYRMPLEYRRSLLNNRGRTKIILSKHIRSGTPPQDALMELCCRMAASGAEIVKIVTRACEGEDNLRTINLIPYARKLGVEMIAFCMGPLGRISRLVSPLVGGHLTFCSLESGEESADGQLPAGEMKRVMAILET